MLIVSIIILALLALIAYQDQKHRAIWWFLPLLLFAGGIVLHYPKIDIRELLFSGLFVAGMIAFLFVYVYFRFKSTDLFNSYFGLGDVLILFALVPYFDFRTYVFFFTIATFASLLIHVVISLLRKQKSVPYAGYMALCFAVVFSSEQFCHVSLIPSLDV